ncbi:MAG TPA: type II toxin-antitoxin system VapC family toxin [Actinospica sp.]|nr:type II toxin-antitoxin system VapC family toxin [Actinospica sp.]
MIYLDTCAALKLTRVEDGSRELTSWLAAQPGARFVSSVLLDVELERALRRNEPSALPVVPSILRRIARIEIDPMIRAMAAAYPDPLLRTLDAIHLATAQTVAAQSSEGLSALVSYDKRLVIAARTAGLTVEHPGARY